MIFHHTITYPDGTRFDGKLDHQKDIDVIGLASLDLFGLSVIDLAANDGFFSFWSEFHHASRVSAVDVGSYKNYDWGPMGPPKNIENLYQPDKWETFDFHHKNLKSGVEKHEMSVYDIKPLGKFDVIFNFGLLYHLRHPQLCLDVCREVCNGFMALDTCTFTNEPLIPMSIDCGPYTKVLTVTDFNLPTESCLASWIKKAGFPHLFIEIKESQNIVRQKFICAVTDYWKEFFHKNERFFYCDESYWAKVIARKKGK